MLGDADTSIDHRDFAGRVKQPPTSPSLRHKSGSITSGTMSNLRVVNVSPGPGRQSVRDTPLDHFFDSPIAAPFDSANETDIAHLGRTVSPIASPPPPSVFDIAEEALDERSTLPTTIFSSGRGSEDLDAVDAFNLKPPLPPNFQQNELESLATRFFSVEHLDLILRDYALALRFAKFLDQYSPQYAATLKQYAQARKAIAAVEYANAIASQLSLLPGEHPYVAATVDERFAERSRRTVEELVEEALPAYLTHRLVCLVTDTLVKEITGNSAPILHELIPSLAEVYCITDPSVVDNPIVYASEEFYKTTQYSQDYVIGRNCRFLQGSKSSRSSVRRLIEALAQGEECCETILNYKRDGMPFMNLLMIAPLYDNKGTVRYFLGAQIDVSSLIEDGRGLESFAQLLSQDRSALRLDAPVERDPKQVLGDLGQLLTEDEADMVKNRVQRFSILSQPRESFQSASATRTIDSRGRRNRVILGMEDGPREGSLWPAASLGPSGRLPGVYQNYLLVRPYPSLRITFTSPALRIPGLLQTKLLDRIGGPSTIREGLLDALSRGTGVTAKVTWLTGPGMDAGRSRWLHCTPLFGSDDRVGVWMVVMVENEQVTGTLNRQNTLYASSQTTLPVRPPGADRYTSNKLYADYLKREGRPTTQETQQTTSSTREQREADEVFRNF